MRLRRSPTSEFAKRNGYDGHFNWSKKKLHKRRKKSTEQRKFRKPDEGQQISKVTHGHWKKPHQKNICQAFAFVCFHDHSGFGARSIAIAGKIRIPLPNRYQKGKRNPPYTRDHPINVFSQEPSENMSLIGYQKMAANMVPGKISNTNPKEHTILNIHPKYLSSLSVKKGNLLRVSTWERRNIRWQ